MQTTLRINERVYRRAKAKSSELGLSLTRFFEEAVEDRLARLDQRLPGRIELPVSSAKGPMLSEAEYRRRLAAADREDDCRKHL
jgi:hypothetical protein